MTATSPSCIARSPIGGYRTTSTGTARTKPASQGAKRSLDAIQARGHRSRERRTPSVVSVAFRPPVRLHHAAEASGLQPRRVSSFPWFAPRTASRSVAFRLIHRLFAKRADERLEGGVPAPVASEPGPRLHLGERRTHDRERCRRTNTRASSTSPRTSGDRSARDRPRAPPGSCARDRSPLRASERPSRAQGRATRAPRRGARGGRFPRRSRRARKREPTRPHPPPVSLLPSSSRARRGARCRECSAPRPRRDRARPGNRRRRVSASASPAGRSVGSGSRPRLPPGRGATARAAEAPTHQGAQSQKAAAARSPMPLPSPVQSSAFAARPAWDDSALALSESRVRPIKQGTSPRSFPPAYPPRGVSFVPLGQDNARRRWERSAFREMRGTRTRLTAATCSIRRGARACSRSEMRSRRRAWRLHAFG